MKVSATTAHVPPVAVTAFFQRDDRGEEERPPSPRASSMEISDPESRALLDFDTVYDTWFDHVCRWLRAHGIPMSDREDVAQEVFLVVQKKLADFDGRHLGAWLFKIAKNTASDHRRRAWFKNMFRKSEELVWVIAVDRAASPERRAISRDALRMVNAALLRMDSEKRTSFILFEIEGYSGDEIAAFESIPVATVWTRLHYARKEFRTLVAELEDKS